MHIKFDENKFLVDLEAFMNFSYDYYKVTIEKFANRLLNKLTNLINQLISFFFNHNFILFFFVFSNVAADQRKEELSAELVEWTACR